MSRNVNELVAIIQRYSGADPDGMWGQQTDAMFTETLRVIQAEIGVEPADGWMGPQTEAALTGAIESGLVAREFGEALLALHRGEALDSRGEPVPLSTLHSKRGHDIHGAPLSRDPVTGVVTIEGGQNNLDLDRLMPGRATGARPPTAPAEDPVAGEDSARPAGETARPEPARARTDAPARSGDDYAIFFMHNVALNNGEFSVHTQRIWHDMRAGQLEPGVAIDNYLRNYVAEYNAANPDAPITNSQLGALQEQLITEMVDLRRIERQVAGVRPTPETIADMFIEQRGLREVLPEAKRAWESIRERGISIDEAVRRQMNGRNDPELQENLTQQLRALEGTRAGIIRYESLEFSTQDTVSLMRERWAARTDLPNTPDHYARMLEQRIASYQTAEGGALDAETASARALVDIRAEIDRANGAVPGLIIDESHDYYQSEVMQMAGWLRNQHYLREYGSATTEQATQLGLGTRDVSRITDLDLYSGAISGGYLANRSRTLDQATRQAYENPQLRMAPSTPAAERPAAPIQPPATPADPLDFAEDFHPNNPFSLLARSSELESQDLVARQSISMGNAIAFYNEGGKVTLERAALSFHSLHDEDYVGPLTTEQQAALATLAGEMGVEADFRFEANDPRLLEAISAYANGMRIADLHEEWTEAFRAISPQIRVPDNTATLESLRQDATGPRIEALPARQIAPATDPAAARTLAADAASASLDVNTAFVEFIAAYSGPVSGAFYEQAYERYQEMTNSFESDTPLQQLERAHELSDFIEGGLAQQQLDFVQENWRQLVPYFEKIGEDNLRRGIDAERGVEILRSRMDEILAEVSPDRRGTQIRGLLEGENGFINIEGARRTFETHANEIETLAARNGIALNTDAPAEAVPADSPLDPARRATGAPEILTPR